MPIRTFRIDVSPEKPERVLTAGPEDVEIQIRSKSFGGIQASSGFTFHVGGPELEENPGGGFSCFSGEFQTDVEEGDEIWVASEPSEFQPATPLTVLIRSAPGGRGETVSLFDESKPEEKRQDQPEARKAPRRGQPAR